MFAAADGRRPPRSADPIIEPHRPQVRSSGASIRGRSQPGPLGPAHLRTALYPPTLVAMRVNPALRAFTDRLRRAGTRSNVIVVALMRKLLLLASAMLRSGRPYSPAYPLASPAPAVA